LAGKLAGMIRSKSTFFRKATELMAKIAAGVNAAHQQGIVHRDLKPANVLLDTLGEPKIADFGISKRDSGADPTMTGIQLGTPAYMSPEQVRGITKFVGPQADVWALGVMLYEVLTGGRPFAGQTRQEIFQAILKGEFVRPRKIADQTPRALELICVKCLSREPHERYTDAAALASDLGNWLEGRPIVARPPGTVETAVKWVRRNKSISASMSAAIFALLLGTGISVWQAYRANAEADRADGESVTARDQERLAKANAAEAGRLAVTADREATNAKAQAKRANTTVDLMTSIFQSSDPTGLSGIGLLPPNQRSRTQTVSEMLVKGSKTISDKYLDDPLTRAALLDTLGDVNRSVGNRELAKSQSEEALGIREKLLPADHEDTALSLLHVANLHAEQGDALKALGLYEELSGWHSRRGTLETKEGAELQLRLSILLASIGDPAGEGLARKGLAARVRIFGDSNRETDIARMVLVATLLDQQKFEESAVLLQTTLQSLARDP